MLTLIWKNHIKSYSVSLVFILPHVFELISKANTLHLFLEKWFNRMSMKFVPIKCLNFDNWVTITWL